MTELPLTPVIDQPARLDALTVDRSFIVQAPAGSGKTELLTQRILSLLATVSEPENILAITFTRKAAAEMKGRLLKALNAAEQDPEPAGGGHAHQTWTLGRQVLAHARLREWSLLQNPSRLQLLTIDSFCSLLTRRMPWLSRFGAPPQITEDPRELYRRATERLLSRLESGDSGAESIALLLDHLDNQLSRLRDLFTHMLGRRDQWLRCLLDKRHDAARLQLEASLLEYNNHLLEQLLACLGPGCEDELLELAGYAAEVLQSTGNHGLLQVLTAFRENHDLDARLLLWDQLLGLLLTQQNEVRRSITVRQGFPATKDDTAVAMKQRLLDFLEWLAGDPPSLAALKAFRKRPAVDYQEPQWLVLDALIELLPLAVVELAEVFRATGEVDFVEISGAALRALGTSETPEELLLQLDGRLQHILVDEFQDTSYIQYELLRRLTSGWERGDGRTLFLVGDPMQSIYRFREAEVGLFLRVCREGLGSVDLIPLQLQANFRSQAGIVDWVNQTFSGLFPLVADELRGAIPYAPATSTRPLRSGPAVGCYGYIGRQDEAEASLVIDLVRQAQAEHPEGTTAILVRARSHFAAIIPALKRAGIRYQAQDLDNLAQRQSIQDLRSLTRALLHPADRVSWLAVLRAPWCGLTLADLHDLVGGDKHQNIWELLHVRPAQGELFALLSADGEARWQRIRPALAAALQLRGSLPLRRLIESTWLGLHGPACIPVPELADAERFFALLEEFDCGGDLLDFEQFDRRLEELYASPDPEAGSALQLMTIHKAKGLQFDTVILPGLGRSTRALDSPLLNWVEHPDFQLLLAPVRRADSGLPDPTYEAIQELHKERDALETARMIYVATTRAITRLHLIGHVRASADGSLSPSSSSLLGQLWDHLEAQFSIEPQDEVAAAPEVAAGQLCRLPTNWTPPDFALSLETRRAAALSASGRAVVEKSHFSINLRSQEGRIIGNLVHQLLEEFGQPGQMRPTPDALQGQSALWGELLMQAGIPLHRVDDSLRRVIRAMEKSLYGNHWQQLFVDVSEVQTEFSFHGQLEGNLIHAAVDRSFVDVEGRRWILDYKTSQPSRDESITAFLERERLRYTPQLQLYAQLFSHYDPDRELCAALYFPMIDHLLTLDFK